MTKKILLATAVAAAMAMGSASAATISFSDSFGPATTNWTENLTLQQFDTSLGTLLSIKFVYGGGVSTTFNLESLDAAATILTGTSSAMLAFGGPISDTLNASGTTGPLAVTAFDGAIDFGGTSGVVAGPITDTDSDMTTLFSGFAPFLGLGTYDISVAATGLSSASGAGNLISLIGTTAFANIDVIYEYRVNDVPEPASMLLVGRVLPARLHEIAGRPW
ncbi:MAG: choice-of-anchor E domain-containing protein [Candidatus Accumulibacter sp. UW20]|jgi:hypothetical protein